MAACNRLRRRLTFEKRHVNRIHWNPVPTGKANIRPLKLSEFHGLQLGHVWYQRARPISGH